MSKIQNLFRFDLVIDIKHCNNIIQTFIGRESTNCDPFIVFNYFDFTF